MWSSVTVVYVYAGPMLSDLAGNQTGLAGLLKNIYMAILSDIAEVRSQTLVVDPIKWVVFLARANQYSFS
jgi:hypothetical protein